MLRLIATMKNKSYHEIEYQEGEGEKRKKQTFYTENRSTAQMCFGTSSRKETMHAAQQNGIRILRNEIEFYVVFAAAAVFYLGTASLIRLTSDLYVQCTTKF